MADWIRGRKLAQAECATNGIVNGGDNGGIAAGKGAGAATVIVEDVFKGGRAEACAL